MSTAQSDDIVNEQSITMRRANTIKLHCVAKNDTDVAHYNFNAH